MSEAEKKATPEYTEEELAQMGPVKRWIKTHPNIWEFILFNILSNVSTIARFVVTWIGTAIFVTGMGLTTPFHFLIFNYDEQGNGLGGFLTFLCAEVIAQVVNFFVQMKFVFKSDASFSTAAPKYAVLAVLIVVVNLVLPGYVTSWCIGWGMGADLAATVALCGEHGARRHRELPGAQVLDHTEHAGQGRCRNRRCGLAPRLRPSAPSGALFHAG